MAALDKAQKALSRAEDIILQVPEDQEMVDEMTENITVTNREIEDSQQLGLFIIYQRNGYYYKFIKICF